MGKTVRLAFVIVALVISALLVVEAVASAEPPAATGPLKRGWELVKQTARKLDGKERLLFGFCPSCNSDAPKIDHCTVCKGYRSSEASHSFPPPKAVRAAWWSRFAARGYR